MHDQDRIGPVSRPAGRNNRRLRAADGDHRSADLKNVILLDGLVPSAFRRHFSGELRRAPWTYGRVSYSASEEFKGWGIPIWAEHPPVRTPQYAMCLDLFRLVEDALVERGMLQQNFRILRIGADGRTDGQHGYIHTDGDGANMLSVLYYANYEWPSDWQGPTQFFRRGTPVGQAAKDPGGADLLVSYMPGRFACFPSSQPHASTPPRNLCSELRMTVSFVIDCAPSPLRTHGKRRSPQ